MEIEAVATDVDETNSNVLPLETYEQKMQRLHAIRNEPEMRQKIAVLWHKEEIWESVTTQKPLK